MVQGHKVVRHLIYSHHFCFMSIDPLIPKIRSFKNLTLKIQGQCHKVGPTSYRQVCFIPSMPIVLPFLRSFQPWKSKVNIVQLTWKERDASQPSHSWDTAMPKFDLENQMSKSYFRLHSGSNQLTSLRSTSIYPPIPEIWLFQNLTLKIQGQGNIVQYPIYKCVLALPRRWVMGRLSWIFWRKLTAIMAPHCISTTNWSKWSKTTVKPLI